MEGDRFCIECGMRLAPEDLFCPSCGAQIPEDAPEPVPGNNYAEKRVEDRSGTLRAVMILTIIWGAIALLSGAYLAAMAVDITDAMIEALKDTEIDGMNGWDYMLSQGVTRDMFISSFQIMGITFAASGLCGLASAFFMYKKINFLVCFILLLICAIFSCTGIITLIVGLIMVYLLHTSKDCFTS